MYVLHVFQKMSTSGVSTPAKHQTLIAARLKAAQQHYKERMAKREKIQIEESSGNIFADLNLPNPEERKTKIWLSVLINRILEERGLTQAMAARLLRITQPKVSALQNYKLEGFSVARLMEFATALEYDVVIELRPRGSAKGAGRVVVAVAA